MNATANFGRKKGVSFLIFDGSENEDVFYQSFCVKSYSEAYPTDLEPTASTRKGVCS